MLLDEPGTSFGLVGSDAYIEQQPRWEGRLASEEVAVIDGLRFALAARPDKLDIVNDKLAGNKPLAVGTSYPRIVSLVVERQGLPLQVAKVAGGQVERLANRLRDRLDAIVDIVDTGASLREQNLRIVADDLFPVSLYGIWPADDTEQTPKSDTYGV
jgi:ATP phosphoribosyltransferase